jgi:hypothetical protein
MIKGEGDDMGRAKYGCHWLEKGRDMNGKDMKGKPLKNNAKHTNEQGQREAMLEGRLSCAHK